MEPTFKGVDCFMVKVGNLDEGINFYVNKLGHKLNWKTPTSAGLLMGESTSELVLHTEIGPETDLLVDDVRAAFSRLVEAGAKVIREPHEIQIGLCAALDDPGGNRFVIVDLSKGLLRTDEDKNVVGNRSPK
jgi:lactoylglutathione lyase